MDNDDSDAGSFARFGDDDGALDQMLDDDESDNGQYSPAPTSPADKMKCSNATHSGVDDGGHFASNEGGQFATDFGLLDENGELPIMNEKDFITSSLEYQDCIETIRQQRERLVRRTAIIDEIRKYYLRDVITIKHILRDVLTAPERESVMKMYDARLPSLDLKASLQLHAPTKCEMQVRQCGECGGQLEIIMKDSDEVERLKKVISDCRERESRFRMKLATLDAQVEDVGKEKAEAAKSHMEEVRFISAAAHTSWHPHAVCSSLSIVMLFLQASVESSYRLFMIFDILMQCIKWFQDSHYALLMLALPWFLYCFLLVGLVV